jgi:hypothetical protein
LGRKISSSRKNKNGEAKLEKRGGRRSSIKER